MLTFAAGQEEADGPALEEVIRRRRDPLYNIYEVIEHTLKHVCVAIALHLCLSFAARSDDVGTGVVACDSLALISGEILSTACLLHAAWVLRSFSQHH